MNNNNNIVSRQWLQENLNNPDVKIIDCRFQLPQPDWGYQEYLKSHIQGAYYFDLNKDLSSVVQKHGGRHPMPNPEVFADKLKKIGVIKNKTMIIAYDSSRFAFAGRLWWLLNYFGHEKVALLDGGWNGWVENNCPVSTIVATSEEGVFEPEINHNLVVDIETVKQCQNSSDVVLIDSRSGERYRGEVEPIDPVAGHIPSAINHFWQDITDSEGYIKPLETQQSFWQPLQDKKDVIVYCGSGVTACINILSLKMSGFKNVQLYAGGWSDWCTYLPENKV